MQKIGTGRTQMARSTGSRTATTERLTSMEAAHRRTVFGIWLPMQKIAWKDSNMLFGNPDVFAIEAELLEIYGKWTYGKLRFWVGGSAIGDFDDTSDLATSARWGRTFLKASRERTRGDLDHMAPTEVYELLYGQFVEPVNSPTRKPWAGTWDSKPYVLDDV